MDGVNGNVCLYKEGRDILYTQSGINPSEFTRASLEPPLQASDVP